MSELNNIPKNWQVKKLGEVCKFYQGYGFPKDLQGSRSGEYPFYKVGDISKNVKAGNRFLNLCDNFIDEKTLIKLKAKPYPKHTIVFAKIGEGLKLNRRAIINKSGIVDNNAIGLKAIESICNDLFLFHFLTTVKLEDYSKATTVPSVRKSEIEDIHFVLPPLTEQLAIVSKIEELLSDLDNGKQQLLTAQQQLKVYRQSLLKAAFEGRLTSTSLSEQKEGVLPEGWKLVKIEDIATVGTGATPLKGNANYYNGNVAWVTSGALNDEFVREATDYVTELALKETNLSVYPKHTLLLAMYGEGKTRGKCSELLIEATTNQAIAAIHFKNHDIRVKPFLKYFLLKNYNDIRMLSSGGVQPNLNLGIVKKTLLPFPAIEEQHQIVEILESKLTVCDKIEETISQSLQQAESLKQSILKKAFEGKLN